MFIKNIESALDIPKRKDKLLTIEKEISKLKEKTQKLVDLKINEKIDMQVYEQKYDALDLKLKVIVKNKNEMQQSLDGEESLSNRIKNFRRTFNTEDKMDEFDRELFESLVEKVAIGKNDSEGNPLPYSICFILKTGLKFDEIILKSI